LLHRNTFLYVFFAANTLLSMLQFPIELKSLQRAVAHKSSSAARISVDQGAFVLMEGGADPLRAVTRLFREGDTDALYRALCWMRVIVHGR
jgi:hypothetical protein